MIGICRFVSKIFWFSKNNSIGYGVPQGSILVPILFGIYVNDLSSHVNSFLVQYADDTQFLHSNAIDKLNHLIKVTEETLAKCRRYFLKNGLMPNSSKTQCTYVYRQSSAVIANPTQNDIKF